MFGWLMRKLGRFCVIHYYGHVQIDGAKKIPQTDRCCYVPIIRIHFWIRSWWDALRDAPSGFLPKPLCLMYR